MTETPYETAESEVSTPDLTESEYHRLLAPKRRRLVLDALAGRTAPVELDDLAADIAAREYGSDTADEETVESVAVTLHHIHLPKLVEIGVLDYDSVAHRIYPDGVSIDYVRNGPSTQ